MQNQTFFFVKLGDGTVRLKQNHGYYLQIQGQLYCSDLVLKGIILTVYFGEDKPLFWRTFTQATLGPVTFCLRLFSFTQSLFTLNFLPNECRGGSLPFGHYSFVRTGFKLRFEKKV